MLRFRYLLLSSFTFLIIGCSGLFDTDNTPAPTPLTQLREQHHVKLLWTANTGPKLKEYLKLDPTESANAIFISNYAGQVTSVDKITGIINWQTKPLSNITTGPGYGDGIVVVGNRFGHIIALQAATGSIKWRAFAPGEIVGQPAIDSGYVVVKTSNGYTQAHSVATGATIWSYQQIEPNLILRASSAPRIVDPNVLVGYANGTLAKLRLNDGEVLWDRALTIPTGGFTVERMIDIDADPIVYDNKIFAATYRGVVTSLTQQGQVRWSHDISSYTGMVADNGQLFITDAKGSVWAFDTQRGDMTWRQDQLLARVLSAPAKSHNAIVVGDGLGYLHWLHQSDGHIIARVATGKAAIFAKPIANGGRVFVLTANGYLSAYEIGPYPH